MRILIILSTLFSTRVIRFTYKNAGNVKEAQIQCHSLILIFSSPMITFKTLPLLNFSQTMQNYGAGSYLHSETKDFLYHFSYQ